MKQESALPKNSAKRLSRIRVTIEIIVSLLVILWIYTGTLKLLNYNDTKSEMSRSPFIKNFATFLAAAIPITELIIAVLLCKMKTRMIGLYGSFSLMFLFTGYIYAMLHYSPYVPCSCGGVLAALSWEDHLIFNSIFAIIALFGITLQYTLENRNRNRSRQ